MVISENREAELSQFQALIQNTNEHLNKEAQESPSTFKNLEGVKLEPYVEEVVAYLAKGTRFEGTIKRWGGNKFPDIVANKFYGIEVKTTTSNHWTSIGNSILESTRIEDVERIFMLFGKLGTPIGFKVRPYQDCLSDIVVTHYPRYLINMDLLEGETIFDKIGIPYDELRMLDKPTVPVASYYRSQLKEGQSLWWLGDSSEDVESSSPMTITFWNSLDRRKRTLLSVQGIVNFPEIVFSASPSKYNNFSLWLIIQEGILMPNVRDAFSAGGMEIIITTRNVYKNMPKICGHIHRNNEEIKQILENADISVLEKFWKTTLPNGIGKLEMWIQLVVSFCPPNRLQANLDFLRDVFSL